MKKWTVMVLIIALSASLALFAQVSSKEMEKNVRKIYRDLLKETDKDKDGKMSKEEFYAIWKDKKVAEKNYKAWDTNKDGYIVEDEYVKAAMDMGKKK
jgi:Ca2+-binding EF-hand superfamily protein